jgi:hypothetical protein
MGLSEVLNWGTYWELTKWEYIGNKKIPTNSTRPPKGKKLNPMGAFYFTSLIANNVYANLCSLPFLA